MTYLLAIDPGPVTSGMVCYSTADRCVVERHKAAPYDLVRGAICTAARVGAVVLIERPAAMGQIGVGMAGHMLDTAWVGGSFEGLAKILSVRVETMTRREVLRALGVHSGKGSADSRVRAAMIHDHGGSKRVAVGTKANPGPLYGVTSHAWQALGLACAWLEVQRTRGEAA